MTESHSLLGGKLHVYRRENSSYWQCSSFINGRNHRVSTKQDSLSHAKDFAEDWFLELKGKMRRGDAPKGGKTFAQASDQFLREIEGIIADDRSPRYVDEHRFRLKLHLLPFFGKTGLTEITPGLVQEYRIHRATSRKDPKTGEPLRPSRSTLHKEIVCLRQVLKCANRQGWVPYLPDISEPFRASTKVSHRGWFSRAEYNQLWRATQRRVKNPPKPRWRRACEQLHDYVLFMGNTGLRPDEAARLQFRDVEIIDDDATEERILQIEVRGKRGTGYCKSMPGAVLPFERLRARARPIAAKGEQLSGRSETPKNAMAKPGSSDLLFDMDHHELFNTILDEEGLKVDREGNRRTAYSLRHTYICLRLSDGADIYQIAKNCRTSVEMIQKYYASHIANTLDAAAINVRKSKTKPAAKQRKTRAAA